MAINIIRLATTRKGSLGACILAGALVASMNYLDLVAALPGDRLVDPDPGCALLSLNLSWFDIVVFVDWGCGCG
jgi:hypothetical protein